MKKSANACRKRRRCACQDKRELGGCGKRRVGNSLWCEEARRVSLKASSAWWYNIAIISGVCSFWPHSIVEKFDWISRLEMVYYNNLAPNDLLSCTLDFFATNCLEAGWMLFLQHQTISCCNIAVRHYTHTTYNEMLWTNHSSIE